MMHTWEKWVLTVLPAGKHTVKVVTLADDEAGTRKVGTTLLSEPVVGRCSLGELLMWRILQCATQRPVGADLTYQILHYACCDDPKLREAVGLPEDLCTPDSYK